VTNDRGASGPKSAPAPKDGPAKAVLLASLSPMALGRKAKSRRTPAERVRADHRQGRVGRTARRAVRVGMCSERRRERQSDRRKVSDGQECERQTRVRRVRPKDRPQPRIMGSAHNRGYVM